MDVGHRRSMWFYIGVVSLTLTVGPFILGILAIATWGVIFVPVIALIMFGPMLLLCWVLWGRRFSREGVEHTQAAAGEAPDALHKRRMTRLRVPRLAWDIIIVIGVVLYYLTMFGAFQQSTEQRIVHIVVERDGVWLRPVTSER